MKTISVLMGIVAVVIVVGGIFFATARNDKQDRNVDNSAINATDTPGQTTTQTPPPTQQEDQDKITIKDFAFSPATVNVKVGTTVTWTNQDSVKHDVTPDQESEDFKPSELLGQNESYSFTFQKAGTYTYHCSPHPNMKGTIVVSE